MKFEYWIFHLFRLSGYFWEVTRNVANQKEIENFKVFIFLGEDE